MTKNTMYMYMYVMYWNIYMYMYMKVSYFFPLLLHSTFFFVGERPGFGLKAFFFVV